MALFEQALLPAGSAGVLRIWLRRGGPEDERALEHTALEHLGRCIGGVGAGEQGVGGMCWRTGSHDYDRY